MSRHPLSTPELRQQLASQEADYQRANFASKLQAAIELSRRDEIIQPKLPEILPVRRYEVAGHLAEIISITDAPSYPMPAAHPELTSLQQVR
ncbi:hypothetical protein BH09PAT4_BH09PAT4_01000 [soil metagenome]